MSERLYFDDGIEGIWSNHGRDLIYIITGDDVFDMDKYIPWYDKISFDIGHDTEFFAVPVDVDGRCMSVDDIAFESHKVEDISVLNSRIMQIDFRNIGDWFDGIVVGCINRNRRDFFGDGNKMDLMMLDESHRMVCRHEIPYMSSMVDGIVYGKFSREEKQYWKYSADVRFFFSLSGYDENFIHDIGLKFCNE